MKNGRYPQLDILRGFALVNMICYHALWDLVNIHGLDFPWYDGWPGFLWQQFICWSFILLAGFCQSFSRQPVRHGVMLLAAGALVSAVTMAVLPEDSIQWGVLTFLGSAALLFHWLRPWLERCPPQWGLLTCVVLFGLTRQLEDGLVAEYSVIPAALYQTGQLGNFLGFPAAEFASADYFPLLPWVFLYGAGWFVYAVWRSGEECELPKRGQLPALAWMGRHSLAIYLLHQPALYGALLAAESWMK